MVGKNLSHYKILEELGRGGMGIVYKAEDKKLDRLLVIKVLPKHLRLHRMIDGCSYVWWSNKPGDCTLVANECNTSHRLRRLY